MFHFTAVLLHGRYALVLALSGGVLTTGAIISYRLLLQTKSVVSIENIRSLQFTAYLFLGLSIVGLILAFGGMTTFIRGTPPRINSSWMNSFMNALSSIIAGRRSVFVFSMASLLYGFFFAFVSGTFVFQPGSSFSQTYGVPVPSVAPVVCCGALGQMPQLTVYLTEQFGVLLIPVNLVLVFLLSWLFGLNSAIAYFAYQNRTAMPNSKWTAGLGALLGLFTACPTCAGVVLLTVLGLAGATAVSLNLSSLQSLFLATSIPILIGVPVISIRALSQAGACVADPKLS